MIATWIVLVACCVAVAVRVGYEIERWLWQREVRRRMMEIADDFVKDDDRSSR